MSKKKGKFDKTAFMFIAPAFILFTLFIIVPTISSVYCSFTSWDGISPNVKFIGLANYKEIFKRNGWYYLFSADTEPERDMGRRFSVPDQYGDRMKCIRMKKWNVLPRMKLIPF